TKAWLYVFTKLTASKNVGATPHGLRSRRLLHRRLAASAPDVPFRRGGETNAEDQHRARGNRRIALVRSRRFGPARRAQEHDSRAEGQGADRDDDDETRPLPGANRQGGRPQPQVRKQDGAAHQGIGRPARQDAGDEADQRSETRRAEADSDSAAI